MITSLSFLLLSDIIYKRDTNNRYLLNENNEFIPDDMNEILDRIKDNVTMSWRRIARRKQFLRQCKMHINYGALKQVLIKYSRDVFGQKRLLSILKKVPNHKASLNSMEIFGMKINSFNPYIYRRVGCFIYWCCLLKPFHIRITKDDITIPEEDQFIMECFNEITAYNLVKMMLGSCGVFRNCNYSKCENKRNGLADDDCILTINIDDDKEFFKDFLYDVHFRSLSRSSFELFMSKFCIVPYCKKGICPLTNFNLQNRNLKFIDEFEENSV